MTDTDKVSNTLCGFCEWGRPWSYIDAVLGQQYLQSDDIQIIKQLRAESTNAKYWVQADLQTSDALIRQKLRMTYPWLSTGAIDALIRGASYVWK